MSTKEQSDRTILYLEASPDKTIIKLLFQSGKIISGSCQGMRSQTETLLREIDYLLKKGKIPKTAIGGIAVNVEQNSYTSMRIIGTTANFLAFSLNIPVLSVFSDDHGMIFKLLSKKTFQNHVVPVYKNEPVITRSKSRF